MFIVKWNQDRREQTARFQTESAALIAGNINCRLADNGIATVYSVECDFPIEVFNREEIALRAILADMLK